MSEFQKKFEAYGGNYSDTMGRFLGSEAMYLRFLNMLLQDESLQQLGDALKIGDMECAFAAAHTLKGVVGNMGLTPLYQAVCTIVEPLRAKERRGDYAVLYQKIQMEFEQVNSLREQLKGGRER